MEDTQRQSIFRKLFQFFIIAFLFLSISPFWHLMPPFAVLSFALMLFHNKKASLNLLSDNKYSILFFSSFFFIYFLGMIYTEDLERGWTDVLLKSSFLLFPLIFALIPKGFLRKVDLKNMQNLLFGGLFLSSIACYINAFISYLSTGNSNVFFYQELSFFQHPSYLGLYINMGVLMILNMIAKHRNEIGRKTVILYIFLLLWFTLFIILLQSKAAFISLGLLIGLFLIWIVFYQKRVKTALIYSSIFVLFIIAIAFIIPNSFHRFGAVKSAVEDPDKDISERESNAARLTLWKISLETMKESPILGVGTGDVREKFNKQLEKRGFLHDGDISLNPHSQYFQTGIALGLIGLLILISLVLFPIYLGWKRNSLLYLGFGLMMAFNILVESMLERQAGVMFFSFFNSLLFYVFLPDEKIPSPKNSS